MGSELSVTPATGTAYATTAGLGLQKDTWYYIELKVKCHATLGTFDLHVDGTSVLSGSGLNTKIGSHLYHDRFLLQGFYNAPIFDDLYFLDSSGSANNDFSVRCGSSRSVPTEMGTRTNSPPTRKQLRKGGRRRLR